MRPLLLVQILFLPLGCAQGSSDVDGLTRENDQQVFEALMEELARAWNEGDAENAANCFTDDAIYSEPPDKQLYQGRAELFEFFGGNEGRKGEMSMVWHHLAYDPAAGIGLGEFSFT